MEPESEDGDSAEDPDEFEDNVKSNLSFLFRDDETDDTSGDDFCWSAGSSNDDSECEALKEELKTAHDALEVRIRVRDLPLARKG